MKVETPQLRWHQIINPQSQKDAGANGPILSCSLLSADDGDDDANNKTGALATAGNTEVNLWRVTFTEDDARRTAADVAQSSSSSSHILVQPRTKNANNAAAGNDGIAPTDDVVSEHTRIEHVATLSRGTNERGINAVRFSPSGGHLVAAGDGGTVAMWSLPIGRGPPSSRWSAVERETDLPVRILFNQSDDVMDVSWSSDSRRFAACSLDHTVTVWELSKEGEWRNVHRSARDHTHYVQGVAYDPKGAYLASMGSDRMLKVYSRKMAREQVVRGEVAKYDLERTGDDDLSEEDRRSILQNRVLPDLLTNSAFALQNKIKTMKFLEAEPKEDGGADPSSKETAPNGGAPAKRHHMFADELTLGSFFRRLAFTPDGAFLVVPAALWHGRDKSVGATAGGAPPASPTSVAGAEDKLAESSFATYLFARHRFDQPYKVLTGLEKPSVVVRPNPVLFKLPPDDAGSALPHRSVFAVLTNDSVLIYDTLSDRPLAMARGLHYAGLTDAAWSGDGRTLFVTSSDGYVSILSFADGELGEEHVAPTARIVERASGEASGSASEEIVDDSNNAALHVTHAGVVVVNTLVPKKKKKATPKIDAETADDGAETKKVTFGEPVNDRSNQPVINTLVPKKKKKVVPTPVTATQQEQQNVDVGVGGDSNAESKRSLEEVTVPSAVLTETPVHILVPKKKKKVAPSSAPVATM